MDILRKGYKLMLVRNSFVYQQDSTSFRGEISDETQKAHRELFCQKYGFDIDRYNSGASEIIAQIPFDAGVIFRVLHVGCGIGTIMKAVRSIYPKCEVVGVEPDAALCRVAGATERVLESLYELLDYYDGPSFEVVIISKEILDALSEEEKGVLGSLCYEDSILIVDESVTQ
jgi:hypothetical protein